MRVDILHHALIKNIYRARGVLRGKEQKGYVPSTQIFKCSILRIIKMKGERVGGRVGERVWARVKSTNRTH